MDSSEVTNTGFIDQLEQQQELNPASSEEASSLNNEFQQFLVDPASAMPLFPDPFGQDFTNAENLVQLPTQGQVELDNFGVDSMADDFSWANQSNFTTWDIVSQKAEVQPGVNVPWSSAPFRIGQSDRHPPHQDTPWMSLAGEITPPFLDMQSSTTHLVGIGPGTGYTPANAG
ncbi:hypothetical protein DIS24_g8877 [Lasiodiplodia hormozganensis]|uniref:Uncharacterized protein n=1 Tax=Lasiodiplodia hormozganensis TaxID=869390 RepID=A0AA40CMM5_9PEZI|nr:hypothetical protein DIS24_g8877 [Lasiodiplodia hormozganensis]